MSDAAHQDIAVVEHAMAVLQEFAEQCTSLAYATLLTNDGFVVAKRADVHSGGNRFASMSSSVQALSDAVSRELYIGDTEYVIIAASGGHVIQLRVPGQDLVLAALFDRHETLGKALSMSRVTADRMSARLEKSKV